MEALEPSSVSHHKGTNGAETVGVAAVLEEFGNEHTDLYLKLFLKRDE